MRDPASVTLVELLDWCAREGHALERTRGEGEGPTAERDVEGISRLGDALDAVAGNGGVAGARLVLAGPGDLARVGDMGPDTVQRVAATLGRARAAAVVQERGTPLPPGWVEALEREGVVSLVTDDGASLATAIDAWLSERRGPVETVHGSLADVFDIGLLVRGASGVGKSEAILELVLRGHRLVADDLVEIHAAGGRVIGSAPELSRHHLEVRGVGILNLADLLGPAAVQLRSEIGLVVDLVHWDRAAAMDRLGIDERTETILGVRVPALSVPVSPGRNLGAILEIAVRNQLLKNQGRHSGIVFEQRVLDAIGRREDAWSG